MRSNAFTYLLAIACLAAGTAQAAATFGRLVFFGADPNPSALNQPVPVNPRSSHGPTTAGP